MSDSMELGMAAQVAEWRRKALANELSTEELAAFVRHCREGRVSASVASAKSKARKAPPNVDAMIDELENL